MSKQTHHEKYFNHNISTEEYRNAMWAYIPSNWDHKWNRNTWNQDQQLQWDDDKDKKVFKKKDIFLNKGL